MKRFLILLLTFSLLFCSISSFATVKYEIEYGSVAELPALRELIKEASRGDSGLIYPPDEHPYIYVNDEYIAHVKANKDTDEYKQGYSYLLSLAKKEMPSQPEGGKPSSTVNNQMNARALMYVFGEVDKAHARETVEFVIEYVKNANSDNPDTIERYKALGNALQCGALVYDWCHDVMTNAQKSELAEAVRNQLYSSDQPCRPDNTNSVVWSDVNGKAVGQPIVYNSIAVTALYDVYPDMYESVMKKIQGTMAQASKIYGEAGALTDGSIPYSREYYTFYVELLFQRMGYDISDIYGVQLPIGYKLLYSRLPYGTHIKQGDSYTFTTYKIGAYDNGVDIKNDFGMLQVMFDDPYLKHYYMRSNYNATDLFDFLLKTSFHKAETPDDLPLAFEAYEPRSEIIHKTSWQEGYDSPQVTAYLNMNNRRSGDHDHANHGSFQLYYKGPLSIENGVYYGAAWGDKHWRNYATRTVATNGLLVYNPDETYVYGSNVAEANDGGQMMAGSKSGQFEISQFEEHMSDSNLRTVTEGTYIGPNENTPAFSYIKGDLTNAYASSKMESYKRGMVFMDTFNETYPGVLVVFDRVTSTKAYYEKTWLLQAVSEPEINGNKMTIKNSNEQYCNGKLVNTVLYPESVNVSKVGGIGVYVSEGQEWPVKGGTPTSSDAYNSGWRCEVKPTTAAKDDIFLNAMFVADADTTAPDLEMTKVEDEQFMGVVTLDRQVMFAKSGNLIDKEFTVEIKDNNAGGNMLTLLTDIAPGKWSISGNGLDIVVESKEYDNAFAFEGKPGTYKVSPVSEEEEITEIVWPEAEKEKIGDFAVKISAEFQYLRDETKLKDGVPYLPASFIEKNLEIPVKREGNQLIITGTDGKTYTFTAGSNTYTTESAGILVSKEMENPPFVDENGVFYINHGDGVGNLLGINASYVDKGKVMVITIKQAATGGGTTTVTPGSGGTLKGVDESKVVWPMSISASSDDGNSPDNLVDRNLETRWSSVQGDGEWACFFMGDEAVEMSAVQIAWYNGDKRNWKFDIEISDDGINFTTVLKGQKSGGTTKEVETFQLPAGTKAKYIRYVGHGEEVTKSLYNSVTEFIIIK